MRRLALFFLLIFTTSSYALGTGGYAGAFLRMGLGARPLALGSAFTAVAEETYAAFYNPGGLPYLLRREASLSVSVLPLDRHIYYVGYAQPIHPKAEGESRIFRGGFAVGWINSGVNAIDARDFDGNPLGALSNSENAFFLSFALQPHERVALGLTGKLLYHRFPSITDQGDAISSTGFGFDVGIMVRPFPNLSAGITLKDLNAKYTWNTEKLYERATTTTDRFPQRVSGGVAYRIPAYGLTLVADIEDNDKQDPEYHAGAEAVFGSHFALRGGLQNGDPTIGLGFQFPFIGKSAQLDYALVTEGAGAGEAHVFSWAFRF